MAKKPVLGKGISALIPDYTESDSAGNAGGQIVYLNVEEIEPNPYQARTEFDSKHIDELTHSIKEKGVIQPIAVNRVGQSYQLITGERRWRATKMAGYDTIPAIIHQIDSAQELMELSLIENVQREDLSPVEEAEGYRSLLTNCYLTQEEVARKVGKDRSTIANLMRLLSLPEEIQGHIKKGNLQVGHARALLGLEEEEERLELGRRCVAEKMTVRQVENAVKAHRAGGDQSPSSRELARDPHLVACEERLQHRFGTAVHIRSNPKKGRIELEYYDHEDLERILELLLSDGE